MEGVFGDAGVTGVGSVLLPGVPDSGGVMLPGSVVLPGVLGSEGVMLPGAGVILLGAPGSEGVMLPGAGVILLGAPESGVVIVPPGAGVVLSLGVLAGGGVVPDGAVVSGVVVLDGVVVSGVVVLLGVVGVTAVPPGQRELSGKYSHRIFIPSGDILISVGELVEELLLDCAMGDLLDWATAILVVNAKHKAVPIRVRDFPIILKLTSTEHSTH
ncbi:hypothetical protein [Nostoc sp. PA-18-2419]|uniref:hypothetical protein n=1 Tax=Nostoc sp. PA-18-2419 TaxID=2575443 RepID=UPI00167AD6D6|nr:hypothetical protein [Nostoc sp. PA-18-2419]